MRIKSAGSVALTMSCDNRLMVGLSLKSESCSLKVSYCTLFFLISLPRPFIFLIQLAAVTPVSLAHEIFPLSNLSISFCELALAIASLKELALSVLIFVDFSSNIF
jgi:hypothetical protein